MAAGGADIIQPDICVVGGLLEMRKIAAIAEAHYVTVAPHNPMGPLATAVNLHFCAAQPNFRILEYRLPTGAAYVRDPYLPVGGYLELRPDRPGWGVEIAEDVIAEPVHVHWQRKIAYRRMDRPHMFNGATRAGTEAAAATALTLRVQVLHQMPQDRDPVERNRLVPQVQVALHGPHASPQRGHHGGNRRHGENPRDTVADGLERRVAKHRAGEGEACQNPGPRRAAAQCAARRGAERACRVRLHPRHGH